MSEFRRERYAEVQRSRRERREGDRILNAKSAKVNRGCAQALI
jgi:hypothetical protein